MNILVLMAGGENGFREAGFAYPKNLIEIDGQPLAQRVLEKWRPFVEQGAALYALVRREENRKYYTGSVIQLSLPKARVIEVASDTAGAACTSLLAIDYINNQDSLLIVNGDILIETDVSPLVQTFKDLDGGILVFDGVHPRWSYVRCDEKGMVIEAAEKRPISRMATAGVYYFARGRDFVQATTNMIQKNDQVENRFYVCPAYNQMILQQARIGVSTISRMDYFSLSTPQGFALYDDFLKRKKGSEYETRSS